MSFEKHVDNNSATDSSSLADPADFNCDPSSFPALGLKKRHFPDVYPEHASKRSKVDNDNSSHFWSSPVQEKKDCESAKLK